LQIGSQFFKTYGTSDFMKYFGVITERLDSADKFDKNEGSMAATRLTLRCQAAMKFLPYRGFYPAERVMQLGEIFANNYMKTGSYSSEPLIYITGSGAALSADETETLLEARIRASKQQAMKLIFGPGILCNSIKAGLAVDYPVLPIRDVMPQGHEEGLSDCTVDFLVTNSGSVSSSYGSSPSATHKISLYTNNNFVVDFRGIIGEKKQLHATILNARRISAAGMTGSILNDTVDSGVPRLSGSIYVYDVNNPAYIIEEKKGKLTKLANNFVSFETSNGALYEDFKELYYGGNCKPYDWLLALVQEGSWTCPPGSSTWCVD